MIKACKTGNKRRRACASPRNMLFAEYYLCVGRSCWNGSLTGTVSFLQTLGKLYDSFGIGAQTVDVVSLSLQDAVNNVSLVNECIKITVATVKQHYNMKEAAATNGTEGTVSKKTQVSLELLEQGMARLQNNLKSINEDYFGDVDLRTLLTNIAENLHAVSHLKNETFTALQYARDFGTIAKEYLKRTTKWSAKNFTHDKSFYPVPTFSLADVEVTKPPTAARIDPLIEVTMTELVDKYRPVRQRTVRSETTKDKAGALPPAVYYIQPPHSKVMFHKHDSTSTVEGREEMNKLCRKSQMTMGTRKYPASRLWTIARLK